jgi:hypothetical protein
MNKNKSIWVLLILILDLIGCEEKKEPPKQKILKAQKKKTLPPKKKISLPLSLDQKVLIFENGRRSILSIKEAKERGFTIIELGDLWTPFVFSEKTPGKDDFKPNPYRFTFLQLANGERGPRQEPFLELFGIPPTLSVLRKRFQEEQRKECFKKIRYQLFRKFKGFLYYQGNKRAKQKLRRLSRMKRELQEILVELNLKDVSSLLDHPEYGRLARRFLKQKQEYEVISEAQRRLRCEGLFYQKKRYLQGAMDWATHQALSAFERKNMIIGWGYLGGKTLKALARPPLENNYATFLRVLTERIMDGAQIIEDGTVLKDNSETFFQNLNGKRERLRNLQKEFLETMCFHIGINHPQDAMEFLETYKEYYKTSFLVGIRFPALPSYYRKRMRLSVTIERGDIWYDFPYNGEGNKIPQYRSRLPTLTLYVKYNNQEIPLIRWPTTVGGWRSELLKDGYEYFKYKNSDIGSYIWKDIVAAPVWIPPETTPIRDLIKKRFIGGKVVPFVDYAEFGPGYASAYGLVAAYHLKKKVLPGGRITYHDNGIRTHGSVDYMSITRRYSHGCHRLYNHLALRLFGFILYHYDFNRKGQIRAKYYRRFRYEKNNYVISLNTRGYYYELLPPVEVYVTEGRILGRRKTPHLNYMRKPWVEYPADGGLPDVYLLDN